MQVERPPLLWEADAELEPVIRVLGEMLALALRHHNDLKGLVLNASNVTIEPEGPRGVASGDYVALTVLAPGEWEDLSWLPGDPPTTFDQFGDLAAALGNAGVPYAYTRRLEGEGSLTVFLPRLV
jgi:hypothetical protein